MQGVEDLDTLLTAEGLKRLKLMCFKNLDFKAKSQDELDLLERFMKMAKDVSNYFSISSVRVSYV